MFDAGTGFKKVMDLFKGPFAGPVNPPKPPPPYEPPPSLREQRFGRGQRLSSDRNPEASKDDYKVPAPGANLDEENKERGNWQTPAFWIIAAILFAAFVLWHTKARAAEPTGWIDRGCAVYKQESLRLMPGQCIENGKRSDPRGPDIVFHPGQGDRLIIIEGSGPCRLEDGKESMPCAKKFDPENRVDHMVKIFLKNPSDRIRVIMPESLNK